MKGHFEVPRDEIPQDEEAARWTEHIRLKRASKRKRLEDEDDDNVIVGTKVDQYHVNWITAYNMLTGIRFTVSRTNAKLDRELTEADFVARHKFSFDITGNELTPSAKYDFKFKDYAPWVFRHLRAIFHLDPADYLMSLTSKYILSELGSPGKSGSFFYFSRDYKYIIKTIHHSEHKYLRRILHDYYEHVRQNPHTLLSQFYGLHRVKIPYGRKIHFVIMNNLFPPHRDIHQMFDLKGSTLGRDYNEEDVANNPRVTLKDLNWLRRDRHLELGPEKKDMFIDQMVRDVELLQRLKIMDYSLLIGIHDLKRGNDEQLREKNLKVFPAEVTEDGNEASPSTVGNITSISGGTGTGTGEASMVNGHVPTQLLSRTPSTLETQRKAKELRQIIQRQKPIPMTEVWDGMPEHIEGDERKGHYFYKDDGGIRATDENNGPGDEIYYLGIIDCLTHYGVSKRMEHFFKGLTYTDWEISAIPPEQYGERFIKFMSGIATGIRGDCKVTLVKEKRKASLSVGVDVIKGGNISGGATEVKVVNTIEEEANSSKSGEKESEIIRVQVVRRNGMDLEKHEKHIPMEGGGKESTHGVDEEVKDGIARCTNNSSSTSSSGVPSMFSSGPASLSVAVSSNSTVSSLPGKPNSEKCNGENLHKREDEKVNEKVDKEVTIASSTTINETPTLSLPVVEEVGESGP